MSKVTIREAAPTDLEALAALHVRTWADTYPEVAAPPTYAIRERQWREAFAHDDGSWFCYVVEDATGRLIGFAKGVTYDHPDLPQFAGELSKIYLPKEHHRQGLGRALLGQVARRFLERSITTMVLFADPANPSCGFYEAMGGERLVDEQGKFDGAYGWSDLRLLAARCGSDPEA